MNCHIDELLIKVLLALSKLWSYLKPVVGNMLILCID